VLRGFALFCQNTREHPHSLFDFWAIFIPTEKSLSSVRYIVRNTNHTVLQYISRAVGSVVSFLYQNKGVILCI
jgi:hypothetical protein